MPIEYLILGVTYGFAAAVQPGPMQAYLVSQTMTNGWRRTLPAAFAPLASDVPIVVLVLVVLTQVPAALLRALQAVGGVFLLYLAYGALQSARHYTEAVSAPALARATFVRAVIMNLVNPNPYLAWTLVLGPLLLRAWHVAPSAGVALVAAFYLTMVIGMAAIVRLLGAARWLGPRVARALVAISAAALGAFGCYQLWSAAR